LSNIDNEIQRVRTALNDLVSKDNINLVDKEVIKLSKKLDELINFYLYTSKDVKI
jgi:hypothetical protein